MVRRENTRSHFDLDMWNRLAPYVLRLFGRHGPKIMMSKSYALIVPISRLLRNCTHLFSFLSSCTFVILILISRTGISSSLAASQPQLLLRMIERFEKGIRTALTKRLTKAIPS
ncbi:hypothetical protein H5410_050486 [Solanum commersonii]|uniref:Uncharacterized protein n=1 Tax=Solanum commersonii TaxID=4109 RepID=A0A9J5WVL1_SOLCO|nr:hypothetical protein H5410_050486 [Solanum commersonii]